MTATAEPGSFRDPSSRVFVADDHVYRVLDAQGRSDFVATAKAPFFNAAVKAGKIVKTTVADPAPAGIPDTATEVLEHERIPFVTYPYEWSFSMLRDAALLHLDLVRSGLDDGIITKDGSSYNVQWRGAQPVFIDVGSFEPVRPGEPWFGYRQFCELFLYPLMIQAYRDLPFHPWLRGSIDGISPAQCRDMLRPKDLRRKGALAHVSMQARLEARHADSDEVAVDTLKSSGFTTEMIKNNVDKLTKLVRGLKWERSASEWSSYTERGHYTDDDLHIKRDFVVEAAAVKDRKLVVDIGCNDGFFSKAALEHADYVVAVDSDHLVVDLLYQQLKQEDEDRIVPLVMNLAEPSPGLGWRSIERKPFIGRQPVDLVLGLAVVHHLSVSNFVPLPDVVAMFADFGGDAVIEFPSREDPMVEKLLQNKRAGVHDNYRLDVFEAALAEHYTVVKRTELPSGTRTLFYVEQ